MGAAVPEEAFKDPRHERLTRLVSTCYVSRAFSQTSEGAFFCPSPKDNKAPSLEGAFLVHPTLRDRMGVGYFYGCRPVAPESSPEASWDQTPKSHPIFGNIKKQRAGRCVRSARRHCSNATLASISPRSGMLKSRRIRVLVTTGAAPLPSTRPGILPGQPRRYRCH